MRKQSEYYIHTRELQDIQTPADDELNVHPKYPVRMWNMTGLTHSKMIITNLTRPTQIFWEMTEAIQWSGLIIIFLNHYCGIAFHKTLPEINLLPWWGWKLIIKLIIPSQFSFECRALNGRESELILREGLQRQKHIHLM